MLDAALIRPGRVDVTGQLIKWLDASDFFLGRIRGALQRVPLLNPLLAPLNRDLIQRVYIPKGPPNPIPYF